MSTISTTLSIRSFRRASDVQFLRSLDIYNRSVHHQTKTDSRDIAYWLENGNAHPFAKLYFCGLFEGVDIIGYLQFAYFRSERLVHIDYFVLEEHRRSQGRFYLFAEQFLDFLKKEHIGYDLMTAEICMVDDANGRFRYSQKLVRLVRQIGMGQLKVEYYQPMLGWESTDTSILASMMVFFPVPVTKLSVDRYLHVLRTIYFKHYRAWYEPLYPEFDIKYSGYLESLIEKVKEQQKGVKLLDVDLPDSEFQAAVDTRNSSARYQIVWFALKLTASVLLAAFIHWILDNKTDISTYLIISVTVASFLVVAVIFNLRNRQQFETLKFMLSVIRDFF